VSWTHVWTIAFFFAFAAFALISALIAVRGVAEIRDLFSGLEQERRRRASPHDRTEGPWPTS
jgi:hypothetical protein